MIICKVAIMNKCLVHTYEWVRPCGVPYPSLRGITLMGNPDIGLEIIQLIILNNLFRVSDNLQDEKVASMRKHKGLLFAIGVIIGPVEFEGVLIDKLVFSLTECQAFKFGLFNEILKNLRFYPDKITLII